MPKSVTLDFNIVEKMPPIHETPDEEQQVDSKRSLIEQVQVEDSEPKLLIGKDFSDVECHSMEEIKIDLNQSRKSM